VRRRPRPRFLVGSFQTGTFDQWLRCQNVTVRSIPCSSFRTPTDSMQVQTDVVRPGGKFAAQLELRRWRTSQGIRSDDRAEVSGEERTGANEGDDLWCRWSTLFDVNFPGTHRTSFLRPPNGMSTSKDHPSRDRRRRFGSWAPIAGGSVDKWNGPGNQGSPSTPWRAPVIDGVWNDIKVHIKWSVCDAVGLIELWHNGAPQTFECKPVPFTRRTS
jgi:hypothetical protein